MKENVAYLLGIVAGVAAVGIICWVKKRGRKETDYDERQYQTCMPVRFSDTAVL